MQAVIENENGESTTLELKDYTKHLIGEFEVADLEIEGGSTYKADKVVDHIVRKVFGGKEIDDSIVNDGGYSDLIDRVKEDFERSKEAKEDGKAKAAKAKEERARAKEEKEKKAAEAVEALAKRQEISAAKIEEGALVAKDEFLKELESLKEQLPDTIKLVGEGGRTAINVDEANEEDLARAFGFLTQKATNNEWLNNQVQFWVGDIVNSLTSRGLYKTQKDAGEAVVKITGAAYSASAISYYAKMADRTPVELRNVEAQPTAYLLIANAAIPKKGDKETDADFQSRLEKFKEGRKALQEKLSSGEVVTRKDIEPHVEKFLLDQGLKKPKTDTVSPSELYKQFYHANVGLEHLLGAVEEGVAIYSDGEKQYRLSEEELTRLRDEAIASLNNIFYSHKKSGATLRDYERGFIIKKTTKIVKKGKEGAEKVESEEQIAVYPNPFWDTKEEPQEEEK